MAADAHPATEKQVATWKGDPKAGSVWRRTRFYTFVEHPQETRHVLDRTLGGDVIYVSGRYSRNAYRDRCSFDEWTRWVKDGFGAKKVAS